MEKEFPVKLTLDKQQADTLVAILKGQETYFQYENLMPLYEKLLSALEEIVHV